MNAIVVYSSQTGRIEQIAHAIAAGLPQGTPCVSVDDMPDDFSSYDCVFAGFWIDDPYSDQASKHLRSAVELLKPGSGVIGTYVAWTDKDKYMHRPEAEEDLHLDRAKAFAQDTLSRLKGQ